MKKKILSLSLCFTLMAGLLYLAPQPVMAGEPYEKICSKEEWEVLKLTNEKRLNQGLVPLSAFKEVQDAAGIRATELITKFSHTRPDGQTCFTALSDESISYNIAGENIAAGQTSPKSVLDAWWNSAGHKANILTESFSHMGAGYDTGGRYGQNWVQLFLGGCTYESAKVNDGSTVAKYPLGTSISDMNRYLIIQCSKHGTSYLPLTESMCSGYNKKKGGTQTITVTYQGESNKFQVSVTGGSSTTPSTPEAPAKPKSLSSSRVTSSSAKIAWKKVPGASGYEVYRATSPKGKYQKIKTISLGKTTAFTDKKLKSNRNYYYKIRAYVKNGSAKQAGSYSSILKVKTKK